MENPPKLPLKFQVLLRLHSFATSIGRRPNMTVNRCLTNLFDLKFSPSSKPNNGVSTRDIVFDRARNLWFRLFVPSSVSDDVSLPVVVYFHGGGFVFFSASSMSYDDLGRRLARDLRVVVVSVNYRLSPEHRYPLPYEDGFDGLKFLDEMGFDSVVFPAKADLGRCFLAGDSAGGNLAHHVAVRAAGYDFKKVNIKGLIAIQPFFGGEERTNSEVQFSKSPMLSLEQADWYWKAFLPDGSNRNHPAAHVFGPGAGDLPDEKFPMTLLIVGGRDQLRDWGMKYYEWLKESDKEVDLVEYPNAIHGFYAVPQLKDCSLLIRDVNDFIQKCLLV
ncbi:probable carboxylesterase 18 [Cucurbita pepo subsp. pepo]|uniref:probable carboxylesterase 18 n=2 Tax=Cucurbita pepo subsp. pepo TaxID=3664 RepID=UPI000C9D9F00|nr:probable carboxylesterase 18 [Cucurbita pepo subsp. pepo]